MAKRPGNRFHRSNLFVVRIWCEDTGAAGDRSAGVAGAAECRGRVQRAVSGEARDFEGWPALIEVLEEMLAAARSSGKTDARRDGNESGNKVRE
jgi:hypothetical protein